MLLSLVLLGMHLLCSTWKLILLILAVKIFSRVIISVKLSATFRTFRFHFGLPFPSASLFWKSEVCTARPLLVPPSPTSRLLALHQVTCHWHCIYYVTDTRLLKHTVVGIFPYEHVALFWDIVSCSLYVSRRFRDYAPAARWFLTLLIFSREDGGDMLFLRNMGSHTDYTTLHPTRWQHSYLPQWEPQIPLNVQSCYMNLCTQIPNSACSLPYISLSQHERKMWTP
jgi:hypothetical protein